MYGPIRQAEINSKPSWCAFLFFQESFQDLLQRVELNLRIKFSYTWSENNSFDLLQTTI